MEIISPNFSTDFSFLSPSVALILTLFCCLFSLFALRLKSTTQSDDAALNKKTCNCACSCGSPMAATATVTAAYMNGGGEILERAPPVVVAAADRQIGASMMEQLVPEITTHALSYLDYPSLCRLSMTNSSMRRAANDDNAWKALYHKLLVQGIGRCLEQDFTMEQDSVTPANGWKAYYAATRAIVNINAEFFNIIRERSLPEMGRFWLNADYVKCVHASGEIFIGYSGVMGSWQLAFNWEPGVDFQIQDVRTRVLADVAWVTMKAYVDMEHIGPYNMTNVFEHHNGRWYLVHHHSSVNTINALADQQLMLG